jgi:hypothetical protein
MVLRYLTMFSSTSPFSSLTCGGIHTEKKKRQKKSIFIYGTTFKKNESGRDFQRVQIWNDRSQKQKKNYGSHPVRFGIVGQTPFSSPSSHCFAQQST